MREKPLISIVIANYNYGRFLDDAIRSVAVQNIEGKVELIICDAASTDNSVEIIQKYASGLPPNTDRANWMANVNSQTVNSKLINWWCSEPDNGQSSAFNKGFSHARGKYLTWLNADDIMLQGSLKTIVDYLEKHPKVAWVTGGTVGFDISGRITGARIGAQSFRCLRNLMPTYIVGAPASFFLRTLFDEVGHFDVNLHYIMDSDLWRRFLNKGMRLVHINRYLWGFRLHDQSKTSGTQGYGGIHPRHEEERMIYSNRYPMNRYAQRIGALIWVLHKIIVGATIRSRFDSWRLKGKNVFWYKAKGVSDE